MEEIFEQCLSCQNSDKTYKILYSSRKTALEAAFFIKLKSGKEVYVYECPKRTGWHITSKYNENINPKVKIYSVFIDGYNLLDNDIDTILNEIKKDGDIVDIRLYGKHDKYNKIKWKNKNIEAINVDFENDQLDSIFINIIMDAIQSSLFDKINSICLVSINNTFNILAKRIKEVYGLYILGFGTAEMENEIKNTCFNKYIDIDEIKMDATTFAENLMKYIEMVKYGLQYSNTEDDGSVRYNDLAATLRKKYPVDADRILAKNTLNKIIKTYPDEFMYKLNKGNYLYKLKKHTVSYGIFKKCSDSYGIIDDNNLGEFYVPADTFLSGKLSPKLINKKVKFKIYKYPDDNRTHGKAGEVELL
jgi:hypothetical protein